MFSPILYSLIRTFLAYPHIQTRSFMKRIFKARYEREREREKERERERKKKKEEETER